MAKKTVRRSHPVTKKELVANNPSIVDQIEDRAKPWQRRAVIVTSLAAAAFAISQAWLYVGLPLVVTDRALEREIGNVKTEVNKKIDVTKDEVVKNQNVIKGEITGSLGEITKSLNTVAKSQIVSAMDQVDMQMRLAFTQKQTLQGQLSVVNQALIKDPNDQLALTRKMQLEDFIRQNDTYMQDAQQKMVKLRNGQ